MITAHRIFFNNSRKMSKVKDESVDLIITSPPYPMIEMWDEMFFKLNKNIKTHFDNKEFLKAFYLMHDELKPTWRECVRVLKQGGMCCINIGDATRTLNKMFQLWSNHSFISHFFLHELNLHALPIILWKKSTNKPNKFMGSGTLSPNAYVTLEHEYILIFRKGNKREFKTEKDKKLRYKSAYFWEERNNWFSDIWFDISGTKQKIDNTLKTLRDRSAAYPLDLALRLINMFSVYNDVILDPFWGTGTTTIASMMLKRNSIGFEIQKDLFKVFNQHIDSVKDLTKQFNRKRFEKHVAFIENREKKPKHKNTNYGYSVITSQEKKIKFYDISKVDRTKNTEIKISYKDFNMGV